MTIEGLNFIDQAQINKAAFKLQRRFFQTETVS